MLLRIEVHEHYRYFDHAKDWRVWCTYDPPRLIVVERRSNTCVHTVLNEVLRKSEVLHGYYYGHAVNGGFNWVSDETTLKECGGRRVHVCVVKDNDNVGYA